MDPKITKFFAKHSISLRDIKYILREDNKTTIHLVDGSTIPTYHTVKDFVKALPTDQFFHPNKGILIAGAQIVDVRDGAYLMADGRSFKYRVHNSQLHDMRLLSLGRRMEHIHTRDHPMELPDIYFSILDNLPLPTCIIERISEDNDSLGHFIYRYCNKKLLEFENITREQMVGKRLGELFSYTGTNRLVAYADVALNGTDRIIEVQDPSRHLTVKLCCYQPYPNYCACVMVDHFYSTTDHPQTITTLLD